MLFILVLIFAFLQSSIVVCSVVMIITINKNLQAKFKEDQEACTFDESDDWHDRPAIRAKFGRWVAALLELSYFLNKPPQSHIFISK